MKHKVYLIAVFILLCSFSYISAETVYVAVDPPVLKVEVKPAAPGLNAVWIDGHWKWNGQQYLWIGGHWEKAPKGKWLKGHWVKRPRGWVWISGHWDNKPKKSAGKWVPGHWEKRKHGRTWVPGHRKK